MNRTHEKGHDARQPSPRGHRNAQGERTRLLVLDIPAAAKGRWVIASRHEGMRLPQWACQVLMEHVDQLPRPSLLPTGGACGRELQFTFPAPVNYGLLWEEQARALGLDLSAWATQVLDNHLVRWLARRCQHVDEVYGPQLVERHGGKPAWASWLSDRTTCALLDAGWDGERLQNVFDAGERLPRIRDIEGRRLQELLVWPIVPDGTDPQDVAPLDEDWLERQHGGQ